MITRIEIQNYKRLKKVELELGTLNVLIGTNGSGKTSFLEILEILSLSAKGDLETAIGDRFLSVITRDNPENKLIIKLVFSAINSKYLPFTYELTLSRNVQDNSYAIDYESLNQQLNKKAVEPFKHLTRTKNKFIYNNEEGVQYAEPAELSYDIKETGLSQTAKLYPSVDRFKNYLSDFSLYSFSQLDVSYRSVLRQAQKITPTSMPKGDGSDFLGCLYNMRDKDSGESFEDLMMTLRLVFPRLEKITFPSASPGFIYLQWKEKGIDTPFSGYELSEGTLRFLFLLTILYQDKLPSYLIIDEPEVSLHPKMIEILTEVMRKASSKTQLVIATHSEQMVRVLRPSELIVADVDEDNGFTILTRLNDEDMASWLQDYTLDELWNMNIFGGQ
jgi:predicted ATPase